MQFLLIFAYLLLCGVLGVLSADGRTGWRALLLIAVPHLMVWTFYGAFSQ